MLKVHKKCHKLNFQRNKQHQQTAQQRRLWLFCLSVFAIIKESNTTRKRLALLLFEAIKYFEIIKI